MPALNRDFATELTQVFGDFEIWLSGGPHYFYIELHKHDGETEIEYMQRVREVCADANIIADLPGSNEFRVNAHNRITYHANDKEPICEALEEINNQRNPGKKPGGYGR